MNQLLRKHDLPTDNELGLGDARVTINQEDLQPSWAGISGIILVSLLAVVAASGWVFLIAMLVASFASWF